MEIADNKDGDKKPDWRTLLNLPKITLERAELAAALSLAQAEIDAARKTESNPFFKSSYADLATVRAAIREAFGKYGLSVVQIPHTSNGEVLVTTILLHKSGQFIEGTLALKPVKGDPQGVGSAITYARRYALMAFSGVAPDDDDGNAASGHTEKPKRTETKPAAERNHWNDLMYQLKKAGVPFTEAGDLEERKLGSAVVYYCTNKKLTLDKCYKNDELTKEAVEAVASGNREFPADADNSLLSQVKEKLAEKAAVSG
jgi:hypothetical protein